MLLDYPKSAICVWTLPTTIDGFNTKWCIAGEGYAQDYLSRSDVWIYFSEDANGQNDIPRACIVDSGEHGITEVRGIMSNEEAKQHLDSHITPVVAEKLKSMPGGEKWQSTMEDMKHLAKIHFKHLQNEPLNKEDLIFLYEIDKPIQSSGYERDPRIEEIRKRRNPKEDVPIVLECQPSEIAWSRDEIRDKTKSYIGPLFAGIFETDIEHIYTKFPETPIRKFGLEIGGRTAKELEQQLGDNKIKLTDYSQDMLRSQDFTTLKNREQIDLVRLKVRDLFSDENMHTTDEIYRKAEEFGLELCPAEVGPDLRLKYMDQPMNEWLYIAMKQITDRHGYPRVFCLVRYADGTWLRSYWAAPGSLWYPGYEFVFRLSKRDLKT
jgi:hypothetical protein